MSNIFKKITSIEPEDDDVLKALNLSIPADNDGSEAEAEIKAEAEANIEAEAKMKAKAEAKAEADPVPDFITREAEPAITETAASKTSPSPELLAPAAAVLSAPAIEPEETSTGWIKWVAIISILVWLGAAFSYLYGFYDLGRKWTDFSPLDMTGIVLAILLPTILIALLFFTLSQLSKISNQAQRLSRSVDALSQPDETAIAKTALMSEAIKAEINTVDNRIAQALARMGTLEQTISAQNNGLSQATSAAEQTADTIASRLSTQRLALEGIAGTFDARMASLSTALDEHSTKLESSAQLAEQKIQEARIGVQEAASGIDTASETVRGNAVSAAASLAKSHEEINSLATMISERSAELDEVYRKHAQDLGVMISQLRDEQQNLSISLEERLSKMRDMALSAKVSAESLTTASEAGQNTVEALAQATRLTDTAVKQRFTEMEDLVQFSSQKADSISDQAARRVQDSLAQTRKEIARIENDMLALQNRLSTAAPTQKAQEPQELELGEPKQPKAKKRNPIRLKALEEDFPPVEPPRFADADPSTSFSGIPKLRKSQADKPIFAAQQPHATNNTLELNAPVEGEILSLQVEPLEPAPLDPDYELKSYEPEIVSLAPSKDVLNPVQQDVKPKKSGWRWRDMLGGLDRPAAENSTAAYETQHRQRDVSDARMIASLSALGLAPAAIVDDGCIIEATNVFKTKGAMAMSSSVARRLGDPARHLHRAMEENPALKTDVRAYVLQFKARLGPIENDREAIRTRLETEPGRAFLLCDAALNG